ncbi:hypothetical protein MKW92_045759, partial [Papaver armeniacum]
ADGRRCDFYIRSDDVYGLVKKAVAAGAAGEITEGTDGPVGKLNDPYGYVWMVSSSDEEKQASLLDVVATCLNCATIYVLLKFVLFVIVIIVYYFYPDLPIYYN